MEAPEGYDFRGKVLKLTMVLHGLKPAARAWNMKLVSVLQEHGFEVSLADASLVTLKRGGRRRFPLIDMYGNLTVGTKEDTREITSILVVCDTRKRFEVALVVLAPGLHRMICQGAKQRQRRGTEAPE
jgi:hypothetical protein